MPNLIPVLTYHALHAPGDDYESNDHTALEADLRVLCALRYRIAPLADVARHVAGEGAAYLDEGAWAALSFDDGPDWDYCDYDYDGRRFKSFHRILMEAQRPDGFPAPTAVSFVIASPQARERLDVVCGAGRGRWGDAWWSEAATTGIVGIGNHSWDHAHASLDRIAQRDQRKGTFLGIDSYDDADLQIRRAEEYIRGRVGGATARLFAHPYGEAPDYLVEEYFPRFRSEHGIDAAFITGGDYAAAGANRWKIPRFVCGEHWKSPEDLIKLLTAAKRPGR